VKILFLDIDSVLNHSKRGVDGYSDEGFAGDPVEDGVPLCRGNVEALKGLLEAVPDAKVVWSTDWRLFKEDTWNGWKNPLKWLEAQDWMKGRVVGKTPKKMSSTRFEEISFWFSENEYNRRRAGKAGAKPFFDVESYAVLDDYSSPGMYDKFGDRFFKCEWDEGLTPETAAKAAEALGRRT